MTRHVDAAGRSGPRLSPNVALGVVAILGAAIYFWADLRLPSAAIGSADGPKIFPTIIGVGIAVSGILLCLEKTSAPSNANQQSEPRTQLLLVGMTLWTLAYYAVFETLGYLLATFLFLLPMLCVFNRGRWVTNLLVAITFTGVAFAVFDKFLGITLPAGLFGI